MKRTIKKNTSKNKITKVTTKTKNVSSSGIKSKQIKPGTKPKTNGTRTGQSVTKNSIDGTVGFTNPIDKYGNALGNGKDLDVNFVTSSQDKSNTTSSKNIGGSNQKTPGGNGGNGQPPKLPKTKKAKTDGSKRSSKKDKVNDPDSYVEIVKTANLGPNKLNAGEMAKLKKHIKIFKNKSTPTRRDVQTITQVIKQYISSGLSPKQVAEMINSGDWIKISKASAAQMGLSTTKDVKKLFMKSPRKAIQYVSKQIIKANAGKKAKFYAGLSLKYARDITQAAPMLAAVYMLSNALEVD